MTFTSYPEDMTPELFLGSLRAFLSYLSGPSSGLNEEDRQRAGGLLRALPRATCSAAEPAEHAAAVRAANQYPAPGRPVPAGEITVSSVMELVYEYGAARLMRNASTPTRRSREYGWAEESHAREVANCDRLDRAIRAALRRAGVPDEPPRPPDTTQSASR